ncbi:MAG TPA: TatD family hydrolase [Candidatus Acidoferrum sp.]|nr:TatD family hydrolase [Candidatus Acidoferrum sp.]
MTTPPPLIDIGLNLGHDSFDHDRDAVLAAARQAGVVQMVLTGTSVEASHKAAALAADHPGVLYSTAGVHPHESGHYDLDTSARLHRMAQLPQVVAIGETGLDFFRNYSSPHHQEQAFTGQLELAVLTQKPVFLHERDAHRRFIDILKPFRPKLKRAVLHCFTGTRDELFACLDLDLYIGITGWVCDERRGLHLQQLLQHIPADRLLLETDAPYLLPRTIHPKPASRRNEPAYLTWVLAKVADCLGRPAAEIAEQTTANARVFFDL